MSSDKKNHWPIAEFARFCCGQNQNGKLAMLVAYFDESGTHGATGGATTVAGFVGDTKEWESLELPWKNMLEPITCFHATDCQHQKKDFSGYTGDQSAKLFNSLASLIAERKIVAIAGSVYNDEWRYASSDKMKAHIKSPFHVALIMAMMEVSKLAKEWDEKVSLVFAKHEEYNGFTQAVHEVLASQNEWENIQGLAFSTPQMLIPLQAADLYAYENYLELLHQIKSPGLPVTNREPLRIICKSFIPRSLVATIEMLNFLADNDKINNLP